jgi:hypothetical protein
MIYVKSECEKCTHRKCAGVGRSDCESWQKYLIAKAEQTEIIHKQKADFGDYVAYAVNNANKIRKKCQ